MPKNMTDYVDLFDYDNLYIDRNMDTDTIPMSELPEFIAAMFKEYIEEYKASLVEDGSNLDVDEDERITADELEFDVGLGLYDEKHIYRLSMHEPSPFNPSGFDFYFYADGTYIGFCES
jgi:hypothetical protein